MPQEWDATKGFGHAVASLLQASLFILTGQRPPEAARLEPSWAAAAAEAADEPAMVPADETEGGAPVEASLVFVGGPAPLAASTPDPGSPFTYRPSDGGLGCGGGGGGGGADSFGCLHSSVGFLGVSRSGANDFLDLDAAQFSFSGCGEGAEEQPLASGYKSFGSSTHGSGMGGMCGGGGGGGGGNGTRWHLKGEMHVPLDDEGPDDEGLDASLEMLRQSLHTANPFQRHTAPRF